MRPILEIRTAQRSDLESVQQCVADAYGIYVDRIGFPPAPMLDDYARLIDDGTVHVAVREGRLEGLIVVWANPDHLYIDNVATSPAARGSGVGRRLMDWAEAQARSQSLGEIRLHTNIAMIENVSYYGRRGFVETHRSDQSGYERIYFVKTL